MSTRSIEEVAAVSDGPKWFQVYVWRDRGLVKDMLQRAEASGYEGIMITVDTAVLGRRERDVRAGFTLPPQLGPGTLIDGALHPAWTWAFARSDPITFANVASHGGDAVSLSGLRDRAVRSVVVVGRHRMVPRQLERSRRDQGRPDRRRRAVGCLTRCRWDRAVQPRWPSTRRRATADRAGSAR